MFSGILMAVVLIVMEFTWIGAVLAGCGTDEIEPFPGTIQENLVGPVPCTVDVTRYPTVPGDMLFVYDGRTFYADGNHLGHDIALPEGTAIHPIACGIVRVYRPATGYGRLAVVIEHQLASPLTFVNGLGETVSVSSFVEIFGHVRSSTDRNGTTGILDLRSGDMVSPEDVVGYVDDDAHNGDGEEHLHFGIRLQSASDAQSTDANWFRGYDGSPSQRKWFADPVLFMAALTSGVKPVFWHPAGTVVRRANDNAMWMIDADARRHPIPVATAAAENLADRAISVTDAELACEEAADPYVSPRAGSKVMKFDDASVVYEYASPGLNGWRKAFISYEAFTSWGWKDADISVWPSSQRNSFFSMTTDTGFRTLRDGTLVKADTESEVSVVSDGRRLPLFDWSTFLALGYRQERIAVVPKDTLDLVAGPRGPMITSDLVAYCGHPSSCVDDCPSPTPGGGGTGGDGAGGSGSEDAGTGTETETPTVVPAGKVLFRYDGPVVPGSNQLQGMWDPPGPAFYDWVPSTFATCPDTQPGDGRLECLLDMPSGTVNVLFTVRLPDGRWWGDMSTDPNGGNGSTIGTVTLTGPGGEIPYVLVSNGSGDAYMNGSVPLIP
jgi:hypothetical protein